MVTYLIGLISSSSDKTFRLEVGPGEVRDTSVTPEATEATTGHQLFSGQGNVERSLRGDTETIRKSGCSCHGLKPKQNTGIFFQFTFSQAIRGRNYSALS